MLWRNEVTLQFLCGVSPVLYIWFTDDDLHYEKLDYYKFIKEQFSQNRRRRDASFSSPVSKLSRAVEFPAVLPAIKNWKYKWKSNTVELCLIIPQIIQIFDKW